jgi:glyoxylase I family protein
MNCRDIGASEAFFIKHFGFARVRTFNLDDSEFIMLRNGSMCLELFSAADASATGGEQTVGFSHLAFEVDTLEPAIVALEADGYEIEPIIDCNELLPDMRVCFFNDADGNRMELMEGYRDEE